MKLLPALPGRTPGRLAIKLNKQAESALRQGHPWIFEGSIIKQPQHGAMGDLAIVFSTRDNSVCGIGLFDPDSPIRIKLLHHGKGTPIDAAFFKRSLKTALEKRESLRTSNTNGIRLVYGESDGFPGLVVDQYAHVVVVKLYSGIWLPFIEDILQNLVELTQCDALVIRLGRKVEKADYFGIKDGTTVWGDPPVDGVEFAEHGVRFHTDVIKGHKTGFFLDHRHNRKRVGELAKGKRLLDVFCYAGGFSTHALAGGALEATSIDISEQALEVARKNVELNRVNGVHHTLAGDAFSLLEDLIQDEKRYDVVVIDPPSFAKESKQVDRALNQYARLAGLGASLTEENGILVLASCSSRVSMDEFSSANIAGLNKSGRSYQLLSTTTHDVDHPIGFPEAAYLKCQYYKLD